MSSPRSIPRARSCRISSSSGTTPRIRSGGLTWGGRRRWNGVRPTPCSIPIPCSPTISPRSSITPRTRSAATTPLQEERAEDLLQVEAEYHRDAVFLDLLLGHAPAEHEVCRQVPAEIAPPGGQQRARGIVGRLLAPQQLDLLVAPDVFEPSAEIGFRIAAPVSDLLQQVQLLGALL